MILHNFGMCEGRTFTSPYMLYGSFDALNWFTPRTQLPSPHPSIFVLSCCTLAS